MLLPPPRSPLFPYTTLFRSRTFISPFVSVPVLSEQITEAAPKASTAGSFRISRSEEHTSELQSHSDLVCRLLLEKKNDPILSRSAQHLTWHPHKLATGNYNP